VAPSPGGPITDWPLIPPSGAGASRGRSWKRLSSICVGWGASGIASLVLKDEAGAPEFWRDVGYLPDPLIERHNR
jgi:hypothetical protein